MDSLPAAAPHHCKGGKGVSLLLEASAESPVGSDSLGWGTVQGSCGAPISPPHAALRLGGDEGSRKTPSQKLTSDLMSTSCQRGKNRENIFQIKFFPMGGGGHMSTRVVSSLSSKVYLLSANFVYLVIDSFIYVVILT